VGNCERYNLWTGRHDAQLEASYVGERALKRRFRREDFSGALKRSFPRINAGAATSEALTTAVQDCTVERDPRLNTFIPREAKREAGQDCRACR